jgi:hypothetical protein
MTPGSTSPTAARYSASPVPSGKATSKSDVIFLAGKLLPQWTLSVKIAGLPAQIEAVPSPCESGGV